jgi:hypothetical protein
VPAGGRALIPKNALGGSLFLRFLQKGWGCLSLAGRALAEKLFPD